MNEDNTHLAVAYYLNGVNFKNSADLLAKKMKLRDNGTPSNLTAIPYYFLMSHAAELFLKAALLKRGFEEKLLRKFDYRHNLKALLSELINMGLTVSDSTIATINGLHEQHMNHSLRYTVLIDEHKAFWAPITLMSESLDELYSLTRISSQGK